MPEWNGTYPEWASSARADQINDMRYRARNHMLGVAFAGGFRTNQQECPHPQTNEILNKSPLLRMLAEARGDGMMPQCPRCAFVRWSNWFNLVDASNWTEL